MTYSEIIWKEFKAGDNLAFEKIYSKYIDVLFRYGSKISTDKELVKDSIQQLFLELYTSRANLSDPDNLEFYLVKALKRIIIRKVTDNQKLSGLIDNNIKSFEVEFDRENIIVRSEHEASKIKLLNEVLETLEPEKKELLFLKFYSGLNNHQIAIITGLKADTVQKQLYRLLKKLQVNFIDRFLELFMMCFRA